MISRTLVALHGDRGCARRLTASADPATCDDRTDECQVKFIIEDPAPDPPKDDPATGKPTKKVTPNCNEFAGPTWSLLLEPRRPTLLPEDRPEPGWVRVTCLLAGEEMWLWMDPGVNAETIARTLLARLQLEPVSIGWTPLRDGALGIVGVPTWLWVENPGRGVGPARQRGRCLADGEGRVGHLVDGQRRRGSLREQGDALAAGDGRRPVAHLRIHLPGAGRV